MANAEIERSVSVAEYLRREARAELRSEYVRGDIRSLAGASERHNRIAGRIYAQLLPFGEARGCRVFISDMRLRVSADVYYYPDVMVVCGEDADPYEKRAPCLVVEVLSPSTRHVDRAEKRLAYTGLASVESYLLFDSTHPWAAGYYRTPDGFERRRWAGGGTIDAPCAGTSLDLAELHRGLGRS